MVAKSVTTIPYWFIPISIASFSIIPYWVGFYWSLSKLFHSVFVISLTGLQGCGHGTVPCKTGFNFKRWGWPHHSRLTQIDPSHELKGLTSGCVIVNWSHQCWLCLMLIVLLTDSVLTLVSQRVQCRFARTLKHELTPHSATRSIIHIWQPIYVIEN